MRGLGLAVVHPARFATAEAAWCLSRLPDVHGHTLAGLFVCLSGSGI